MSQSDDKSRKTEKPTRHKLKELRKKGQVPRSKEIVSTVVIVALFAYTWIFWDYHMELLKEMFLDSWSSLNEPFEIAMGRMLHHVITVFAWIVGPALLIGSVAVILSSIGQFGFLLAVEPVKPDFNKVNPVNGAKKIFGAKNLMETGKSIIKIALLSYAIYWVMMINIPELMKIIYCDIECAHELAKKVVMYISLIAVLLLILLSVFDRWFQNYQFIKENMMTREELKRDHKSTEGDPLIKRQRRSQQQEDVRKGGLAEKVKEATAILVSGQYAIGLMYEQGKTPLPMITFMEKEETARRIVALAEKEEAAVFIEDDLVNELWVKGKVDQFMPTLSPERVNDVAKIIVQAMRNKMGEE